MKIAICGSGNGSDPTVVTHCHLLGRLLAQSGILVLTGACYGYPHEVAVAVKEHKGVVMGISPAKDIEEHVNTYKFDTGAYEKIEFTGLGIPARNYALVDQADAIIIVGGQIGTLNEFTIAFAQSKPIGVLQGSGGMTDLIPHVSTACDKRGESKKVIMESDPQKLLDAVTSFLKP